MSTGDVLSAIGGAAGFGGVLAPALVYASGRRQSLVDELQHERDQAVTRLEQRDAMVAALWDYVLELRYWLVKGSRGEPPTMPETLTIAAVRTRVAAPPIPTPR